MSRPGYTTVPKIVVEDENYQPVLWRQMSSSSCERPQQKDREERKRERLNMELLVGVLRSDYDKVSRLLKDEEQTNPNARCTPTLCSAAHLSALRGELNILKLLLENGAIADACDKYGSQPVHYACWSGHFDCLDYLLKAYPHFINSPVRASPSEFRQTEQLDSSYHYHEEITSIVPVLASGSTPLHVACKLSRLRIVEYLLEANADVNAKDDLGLTPLDVVGNYGIGNSSTDASPNLPSHMYYAYEEKPPKQEHFYPTLDSLFEHAEYFQQNSYEVSPNAPKQNETSDGYPSSGNKIFLLDDRMSPTQNSADYSRKPLYSIVNALINKGAQVADSVDDLTVKKDGCSCKQTQVTALHTAVLNEDIELIDCLLENGANLIILDEKGESPLHLAVRKNLLEPLKIMLSWLELDLVDIKNSSGLTPLQLAVEESWVNGVAILLEAGANIKVFTPNKHETVFHMAARNGCDKVLNELLLVEEADMVVNETDREQLTPIFRAIQKQSLDSVELLVKFGVDLQLPDGITVLHCAAEEESIEILTLLLQNIKATLPYLVNQLPSAKGGMAPLHLAAKMGKSDYVKLLLDNGADIGLKTTMEPENSSTALHLAARKGFTRTGKVLLEHDKLCVRIKDGNGWTPLHVAAFYGHGKMVVEMLRYGANIGDTISYHGVSRSALDLVILNVPKSIDLLEKLLDSYVDPGACHMNSPNCSIILNFDILLGPTAADPLEDKQLIFLNTLLNAGNEQLKERIMLHPLVESFLFFKWQSLKKFFIILMFFYITHTIALTTYSVLAFVENIDMSRTISCTLVLALLLPIIIIEILHLLPLQRYYLLDNESWIKWAIIVTSFLAVVLEPSVIWSRHIASLSVLLSWTELLFLLARFPAWGLHVLMFEKVTANIFQVLSRYMIMFIGFMFAFMIHFGGTPPFGNVLEALCKVLIMVVELDYNSMYPAGTELSVESVIGRILFIAFVLLVAMVMTNLMVGLAVSDIAVLENQGRAQRLAKQTAFLSFLELCVYNNCFIQCLPHRLEEIVVKCRSVPPSATIEPNSPRELLPANIRATLLSKVMEQDEEDYCPQDQPAKLEKLESKLENLSAEITNLKQLIMRSQRNPNLLNVPNKTNRQASFSSY